MVRKEIEREIGKAAENFGMKEMPKFSVEIPADPIHGDYSTNIALVLAKKFGKNPIEVAGEIIKNLNLGNVRIEKAETAPPGFINFYLSREFFIDNVKEILKQKSNYGKNQNLKNKKVVVEYTNANPFKVLHIGHVHENTIGESIARITEFQRAKVKKVCYQGDVGLHVAKAIYGKLKNPNYSWQEAYVFGSEQYEKDKQSKKEIIVINKKIYERSDKAVNNLYNQGKKESLNNFDRIYKKLGTKFDYFIFESEVADDSKKIVESNLKNGVFEKGEKGAVVFKGEKFGLHTRVFINSEDLPTYEAKELELAKEKYKKYKYDISVVVTGNEIKEYFRVVMAAMHQIFPELEAKTKHISHGMLRLPTGKMSSRTGNVITAESLIDETKKKIKEKIGERNLDENDLEKIAIGAIKYPILKQSIGNDVIYDVEKSISFQGDSGPYLQYSLVRALSVLKKAAAQKIEPSLKNISEKISPLEKLLHRFGEAVEKASTEYEPHYIALYLTELASAFNNYYANNKIVDKQDRFSPYKIALTKAFSTITKNSLWLLGIPVPKKM